MAFFCRDAYGVPRAFIVQHGASRHANAHRDTGRCCGDRSGSSKPRDEWWSCKAPLTGPLVSQQGCFRCPAHAHMEKRDLQTFFEAQRAEEEKKDGGDDQQGGAQQGDDQHPATVRDLIQRVFTANGVTDQGLADLCHGLMAQTGFPGTYSLETGTDELAAMKDMTSINDIWKVIYPDVGLDLPHAMKFAAIVKRIP